MNDSTVRDAYAARATEYIESLGSVESMSPDDTALISAWGDSVDGRVIDAGSGPGHWTHHLHARGVVIEGFDLVPDFVESARHRFAEVPFRIASLDDLGVDDAALGGLLSWYSIIHTPPAQVSAVMAEFARCVRPGGSLLLGFFEGPVCEPFDHAVLTAYVWPVEVLSRLLDEAGFAAVEVHTRTDDGHRPHGAIVARRRGSA